MRRVLGSFVGGTLVLAMVLLQATAGAAAPAGRTTQAAGAFGLAGNNHVHARVVGSIPGGAGGSPRMVYAQDGTCPDGIDVFQQTGSTLTWLQNVQVGCSAGTFFGTRHLLVRNNGTCLIFSSTGDGTVYSLAINSDGTLNPTPVSSVYVGGFPGDLGANGSTIVESNSNSDNPTPTFDTFSLGSGCTLTLLAQSSTGTENDINIAVSGTLITSADYNSGNVVVYSVNSSGVATEISSTPGQIVNPDSVALMGNNIYTGQATFSPPQVQGMFSSGFSPIPGSPVTNGNPNSSNGSAIAVWDGRWVLQAETFSGRIAWYSPNPMAYGGDTHLQVNDDPVQILAAGHYVLVAQAYGGDLEACHVTLVKVSGCRTVASLTGAGSGFSGSVAIG